MRFFRWSLRLTLVCLFLLIVACQSESATPQPTAAPEPENGGATDGELVIYSGRSESLIGPLLEQFSQATGIKVQARYGDTAEMAATLLEEGQNSPADLFYAQDPAGLGAVSQAGLLAPLPAEMLDQVPDRFAAADGNWVGVSGRARVIVYNTETLSEADLPADMWGFAESQWQGKIGWAPTNGSFQAMVTAMRVVWGEEQTAEWLQAIQANQPVSYEGNSAIVQAVAAGEVQVGFVNHYYLYRFLAEEGDSFPAANYFLPSGDPGSIILVSGIGLLKTAPNSENALRFIQFLLSLEGQEYFVAQTYEYPVIAGVPIAPGLPALADLDAMAANVPLTDLTDLVGTVQLLSDLGILP